MAAKKKYNNTLRPRKNIENLYYFGTFGPFSYDEPRRWGDMTMEELYWFQKCHDKKTVDYHLTGVLPADFVSEYEPKTPKSPLDEQK